MIINDFLDDCESNCNSKDDFVNRLKGENEALSNIHSGLDFIERQDFKHNIDYILRVTKTGAMTPDNIHNSQIRRILSKFD